MSNVLIHIKDATRLATLRVSALTSPRAVVSPANASTAAKLVTTRPTVPTLVLSVPSPVPAIHAAKKAISLATAPMPNASFAIKLATKPLTASPAASSTGPVSLSSMLGRLGPP